MHTVTMTRNGIETVIIENGTFEEAQKALDDYLFGASAVPVTTPTQKPSKSWITRDGLTVTICGGKWHPLWGLLRNFW